MRVVIQRVLSARVTVDDASVAEIGAGLLVYAGAAPQDTPADIAFVAEKVAQLRIFPDEAGKMNRSVLQTGGAVLLVSAFTVQADARHGRRPSFDRAAPGPVAAPLIDALARALRANGLTVATGQFAAHMHVHAVNDGPICIVLDAQREV